MSYDAGFYPDNMWTNVMSKQQKVFFYLYLYFIYLLYKKREKIQDEIEMKGKKKQEKSRKCPHEYTIKMSFSSDTEETHGRKE